MIPNLNVFLIEAFGIRISTEMNINTYIFGGEEKDITYKHVLECFMLSVARTHDNK